MFAVFHPRDSQGICVLQFWRQRGIGEILITNRSSEPEDCPASDGSASAVGRSREWSPVDHRIANLDAGWESVEENPADLFLEHRNQIRILEQDLQRCP